MKLELDTKYAVNAFDKKMPSLITAYLMFENGEPVQGEKVSFRIQAGEGRLLQYSPFKETDEKGIISDSTDKYGRAFVYFESKCCGFARIAVVAGYWEIA